MHEIGGNVGAARLGDGRRLAASNTHGITDK